MTDPVSLTAGTMAEGRSSINATLAFQEFIKAGAGEAAKKLSSEAIAKMGELRKLIVAKFKGYETVEAELVNAETGDTEAIANVGDYLSMEMRKSPEFVQEVQQLAQEINQCVIENSHAPTMVNYGNQNKQINNYGGENYTADSITVNKT